MTDDELIERLSKDSDRLPRETVDEILRRGESLAPRLAGMIQDEAKWMEVSPHLCPALHATFLLAALKPPGALDTILRAVEHAEHYECEDVLDAAPSILASFSGEGLEPLPSLLRDRRKSETVRENAGLALLGLAQTRPALREAVGAELRAVAGDPSEAEDFRAWNAGLLLDLADPRDRALLLSFAENEHFDRPYVEEVYDEGSPAQTVPMGDWLRFYDSPDPESPDLPVDPDEILPRDPAADVLDAATADPDEPPPPLRRDSPKVGRNAPCPCGSGAKFKKCCGK